MSLPKLITHIIIEDTNRNECSTVRAKTLTMEANMVKDKLAPKRYENKLDQKKKNNFRNSHPKGSTSPSRRREINLYVEIMHLSAEVH